MTNFDDLLLMYPAGFRAFIMNIAQRHSMYGTKIEAQVLYEETHVVAELVEVVVESEGWYSWTFTQRGYGMTVPTEYLLDMAMSGKLVMRGEKHEDSGTGKDELPADSGSVGRKVEVPGGPGGEANTPSEGIPYP